MFRSMIVNIFPIFCLLWRLGHKVNFPEPFRVVASVVRLDRKNLQKV